MAPSGQRMSLDTEGGDVSSCTNRASTNCTAAGIQRSRRDGGGNVDLTESDLTPMDPKEVVAAVTGRAATGAGGHRHAEMTDATQEAAQRIWWYLLFAGVLLLAAETLVSNRLAM